MSTIYAAVVAFLADEILWALASAGTDLLFAWTAIQHGAWTQETIIGTAMVLMWLRFPATRAVKRKRVNIEHYAHELERELQEERAHHA